MLDTITLQVTLYGETREIVFFNHAGAGDRLTSINLVVTGRFPTGTKLHRSTLTLWRRNLRQERPLRGETAATLNGEEYIADFTLHTHNRNVGRINGWWNEATPETVVAQW